MSEFLTTYPKTVKILKGLQDLIRKEEIELDHLSLIVKIKKDEIITALVSEGFRRVKLENRKPSQIGHGFAKKLAKPWEMHVRLLFYFGGQILPVIRVSMQSGIYFAIKILDDYSRLKRSVKSSLCLIWISITLPFLSRRNFTNS